jgi:large conductance mechanosensitive channel
MGLISEFKEFIQRGNVVDLAVGVVIGGAFGKIVTSLVNDIIMPPIGLLLSGVNFKDIHYVIKQAVFDNAGKEITPAVSLNFGNFIQILIEFLIVAFAIFMVVKGINKMKKSDAADTAVPAGPSNEEKILIEIRELLKK